MEKNFCCVVDMVDDLIYQLEQIDIMVSDFYSENNGSFDEVLGTYQMMKCKFETDRTRMNMIYDKLRFIIKEVNCLKREVNYFHENK